MNKKGFTLIELLSVVTIIALISLIVIPNIQKGISDKKNEIGEITLKLLSAATDTYIDNNKQRYDYSYEASGSTYCIPIQTLIDNGVLETPFKNEKGEEIDYSNQVKATYIAQYNSFNYEIVEECTEIKQYISRPNLQENMIPVIYDESTNKWIKADQNSHWYNYQEKKWANAVLVKEIKTTELDSKSRYEYKEAPAGTPILESDIIAQFVWIPRFRYQLFNSNSVTPINIIFESVSTNKSMGTTTGQWLTHPAFTYNNQELSGIWVGKYETSNQDNNLIIKSNQTPWTGIDYNSANEASINMINQGNIYGLEDVNTHLILNNEWAATAYLTNSIYGNLENNSTTGNNTGIYNMAGNKEYVNINNVSENDLGQALFETKNWNNETNTFSTQEKPYLTRGNTSIFNYNSSGVNSSDTTFRVTFINNNTSHQDYLKPYLITFDAYGGSVSQTSKEVTYGQTYGELPTPTREGYTFVGWRGKNMFDEETILMAINGATKENGYYVFNHAHATQMYGKNNHLPIYDFRDETQYTYTIYGYVSDNRMTFYFTYTNDDTSYGNFNITTLGVQTIKSRVGETIENLKISYGNNGSSDVNLRNAYISHIQLEEGDTATEYEPYQIYTSNTAVTKNEPHTLYAVWQKNA